MLSVFTPVFNRAHTIGNLYESLCRQTDKDFEWIVVDDGSSDNIDEVMKGFIEEGKLEILYIKQPNGGKHRAINRGVRVARGEYFFIVDSDDYVSDDAVEWIRSHVDEIKGEENFAGISGIRVNPDGTKMEGDQPFDSIDADSGEIRSKYKIRGELAEVYKTSIMRRFPFPEIPGERFCSEGLVWSRIARSGYKLRYFYKPLIVCEYRPDGLTMSRVKNRMNNPEYSMLLYAETVKDPAKSIKQRLKAGLLFWRYSKNSKRSFFSKAKDIPWPYILLAPFGVMMRCLPK